MSDRPIILASLGAYLPGFRFGGPLVSVIGLVEHLGDEFDFRILTSDRDLGDSAPYESVQAGHWTRVKGADVYYTPRSEQNLRGLGAIIRATPHDLLYLNSFFSPRFTILPLVARRLGMIPAKPLVIAPRGELSEGALSLRKGKKRAYLVASMLARLYADAVWQASSAYEAEEIRRALRVTEGKVRVAGDILRKLGVSEDKVLVAGNLPAAPLQATPPPHPSRTPGTPLRAIFLSRISPKKNLDYALRVLASVRAPVDFSIYGPGEDAAHVAACKALATALPPHIRVQWCGPIDPADVPATFARHDLFFFPTRGENFGHVIAESLGAGTPVLLSDRTPWRDLAAKGIGHDLPLADPAGFVAAIEAAAAEAPEAALARRERVFAFALERQRNSPDVEANRLLFATALGTRS
jgi:glycosyltransferase involved in cell wall biosynthesis